MLLRQNTFIRKLTKTQYYILNNVIIGNELMTIFQQGYKNNNIYET